MTEANQDFQQMGVDFQNTLKDFILKTEELRKNELKRVVKALAAHPLEEDIIGLVSEDEKTLFKLGTDIQSIKLNMMVESLKQDALEETKKTVETKVPDHIEKPDYVDEG